MNLVSSSCFLLRFFSVRWAPSLSSLLNRPLTLLFSVDELYGEIKPHLPSLVTPQVFSLSCSTHSLNHLKNRTWVEKSNCQAFPQQLFRKTAKLGHFQGLILTFRGPMNFCLCGPLSPQKIFKTVFYDCVGIKANLIQAGSCYYFFWFQKKWKRFHRLWISCSGRCLSHLLP